LTVRAIVIGNIALDETFHLDALPRPGETVLSVTVTTDLGGKGANQAVVLGRCGVPTRLVACTGRDTAAAQLRAMLATEPLDVSSLIARDQPTDRSIVLLTDAGENAIVSIATCARSMTEPDVTHGLEQAAPGDVLLMQGNLTPPVTGGALGRARQRGLRTVLNPAPAEPGFAQFWNLVDLAVLNAVEAQQLSGQADPAAAARYICDAGAGIAVATLGAEGALLCAEKTIIAEPAPVTTVRDTTGAGDTFIAVLVTALFARNMPHLLALRAAARASALTISRPGTLASFPTPAELAAILDATQ
jgi:ribokinase